MSAADDDMVTRLRDHVADTWLGDLVRSVSPQHRRWRGILESLTLDPDDLPDPLPAPGPDDFVICGCPRSGTTLLSAQLFQPPRVVTAMEPWDGMRMAPADLFASLRGEIDDTGSLTRTRLDPVALQDEGRVRWRRSGQVEAPIPTGDGYLLGVKWPAFWRYLERLPDTRFLVCVRHPLEVVASFERKGGRLAEGFDYDIPFNARMNARLALATDDPRDRRVLLYEHINSRIVPHLDDDNVLVVRYERWFRDPGALREEIGAFLGVELDRWPVGIRPGSGREGAGPDMAERIGRLSPVVDELGYDPASLPAGSRR